MMMAAAVQSGNFTFTTEWFLTQDEDGVVHDATEDQPDGSERDVVVEFDFSAEEAKEIPRNGDMGGYPGCDASCDTTKVSADFDGHWVDLPIEFVREVMDSTLTELAWEHMASKQCDENTDVDPRW